MRTRALMYVWAPLCYAFGTLLGRCWDEPNHRLGDQRRDRLRLQQERVLAQQVSPVISVGDGVCVGVGVPVGDGVGVCVPVGDGVGVCVPVGDSVGVGVPVGDGVGVCVPVGDGVGVGVGVSVGVGGVWLLVLMPLNWGLGCRIVSMVVCFVLGILPTATQ